MTKTLETRNIGSSRLSISDDGTLKIEDTRFPEPLVFTTEQAQELLQWLTQQKNLLVPTILPTQATEAPIESSEETAQRIISDAIALARERYPASLDLENRDRFIDQVTRDPEIKPLVAQGKISRKQIMLWIEQKAGGGAPSLWTQDKKRGR